MRHDLRTGHDLLRGHVPRDVRAWPDGVLGRLSRLAERPQQLWCLRDGVRLGLRLCCGSLHALVPFTAGGLRRHVRDALVR